MADPQPNKIDVDITCRLPLSEVQRLKPPQMHALLDGVARVIAAGHVPASLPPAERLK